MKTVTTTPLAADGLIAVAVFAIIAKAALVARDPEWDKWRAYEAAKQAIADFSLLADEYERAIKLLAEALNL